MSVHTSVHGELPGLKSLIKRMNDANRRVLVGVPAGAKDEDDGTPVAMIAAVNEFGLPEHNIPERSFLRGGIRRGIPKFNRVNEDSLRKVVRGEMTVATAIEKLGVVATGEVKREFVAGNFQPLKPATIAARKRKFGKASTRPLIASGNLRQSITYVLDGQQSSKARVIE
jgi:hypothetical protein